MTYKYEAATWTTAASETWEDVEENVVSTEYQAFTALMDYYQKAIELVRGDPENADFESFQDDLEMPFDEDDGSLWSTAYEKITPRDREARASLVALFAMPYSWTELLRCRLRTNLSKQPESGSA